MSNEWNGPAPYSLERVRTATTIDAMRAEIERQRLLCPIVRASMAVGESLNLSKADEYTVLSYNLLDALTRSRTAYFEHMINCHPNLPHHIPCATPASDDTEQSRD